MKSILTDTTKCIGCRECIIACKKEWGLKPDHPRRWTLDDGLSARNWTSIIERPGEKFVRKQCRHCLEPACVSVCPVTALHKDEKTGAVVYDGFKCLGCRYCMMACPYGIPRYDWDQPIPYVRKCIMCKPRLDEGKQPACTEACPTGATIFGERDELLAIAKKRIEDNPGKYIPRVWGEKQVGGTAVMYLSDIDLSFLTFDQELGEVSLPSTTAPAMQAVPFAFLGMGATMVGLHWFFKRREDVQHAEGAGKTDEHHHSDNKGDSEENGHG